MITGKIFINIGAFYRKGDTPFFALLSILLDFLY